MKPTVTDYHALVFDCDGVVLHSNRVKTDAFYRATLPYGEVAAQAMVAYHISRGGVSRYKKFAHFLERIVPHQTGPGLEELLEAYARHVSRGLLACEVAPGLEELRKSTPHARWLIVSGGDQAELRKVFSQRSISKLFDGGIFGSPDSKDEILQRELSSGLLRAPALFLGDSRYDHQASENAGLDFVFVSKWSEFDKWPEYCEQHSIPVISTLSDLLPRNKGVS